MTRRLTVRVGRESPGTIEVPETYETSKPFDLEFLNDGRAVHVHVTPDDDLARVLAVDESNHFLESEGSLSIPVRVADVDEPVSGDLRLVTAYGAESRTVTVTVAPDVGETPVDPGQTERRDANGDSPVAALAAITGDLPLGLVFLTGLALVVAAAAAYLVGGLTGLLGVGVLTAGLCVAGWLVLSERRGS